MAVASWRGWSRPLGRWGLVVLAALGAAGLERGGRLARARWALPTRGAEWIWAAGNGGGATAFYAARDFEVAAPPPAARLWVQADEEYVLFLNGRRLGSGRYAPGAPLDGYAVGTLLRPGWNRVVAELRSSRGAGGFLAVLDAGADEPALVSDPAWRVFRGERRGLLHGWLALEAGEPARSWGAPPTGRWGAPALGPVLPAFEEQTAGAPPVAARQARALAPVATGWAGLPPQGLAGAVLLDWGAPATGYLELRFQAADGERPATALLWTGYDVPDPGRDPVAVTVVAAPAAPWWRDAWPRRFRYALVVGPTPVLAAQQVPARTTPSPAAAPRGLLGVTPPPLRTPMEDELRRQLEGLAGVGGGEEG